MAKKSVQVPGNKHSSGIEGIREFVEFLHSLPYVRIARVGNLHRAGLKTDTIRIKKPGDAQSNYVHKTISLIWGRTTGRQDVKVNLVKNVTLENVIEEFISACVKSYPSFKVVNDYDKIVPVEVTLEPQPIAKKTIVQAKPEQDLDVAIKLGSVSAAAYANLLASAVKEGDRLLLRGNIAKLCGSEFIKSTLKAKGLIKTAVKGVAEVFEKKIKVINKVKEFNHPVNQRRASQSKIPLLRIDHNLLDDPEKLGQLLVGSFAFSDQGELRSREALVSAALALDEASKTILVMEKNYQQTEIILAIIKKFQ